MSYLLLITAIAKLYSVKRVMSLTINCLSQLIWVRCSDQAADTDGMSLDCQLCVEFRKHTEGAYAHGAFLRRVAVTHAFGQRAMWWGVAVVEMQGVTWQGRG